MSEFLRDAIHLYMEEREWLRRDAANGPKLAGTNRS